MNKSKEILQYYNEKENRPQNLGCPSLELADPTPNIYSLFAQFNERFFWGKLGSVSVRWSKRMYSCAGICRYRGREGFCEVALSEPLLKLRSRKNLIETLLHEMIHAYLFITHNCTDRDGHGPNFHEHMYRINKEANINITVFHNFRDEVSLYKVHWWKCDGPCRNRSPFFGTVRRSSNRAPSHNDFWWKQHQETCGGTFIKIKEPEKKQPKKKTNQPKNNTIDIRKYIKSPEKHKYDSLQNESEPACKKFKPNDDNSNINLPGNSQQPSTSKGDVSETVRNHWANKYFTPKTIKKPTEKTTSPISTETLSNYNKLLGDLYGKDVSLQPEDFKLSDEECESDKESCCPLCYFLIPIDKLSTHMTTCIEESILEDGNMEEDATDIIDLTSIPSNNSIVQCPICNKKVYQSSMDDHFEDCLKHSFVDIDNDVKHESDENNIAIEENTVCLSDNESDNCNSKNMNTSMKRYPCPCCLNLIYENLMNDHLEDCLNTFNNIDTNIKHESVKNNALIEENMVCLSDSDIDDRNNENNGSIKRYPCPCCSNLFDENLINDHLDVCAS